jgi:hypothetical protein
MCQRFTSAILSNFVTSAQPQSEAMSFDQREKSFSHSPPTFMSLKQIDISDAPQKYFV